jgi:hypothetical protein
VQKNVNLFGFYLGNGFLLFYFTKKKCEISLTKEIIPLSIIFIFTNSIKSELYALRMVKECMVMLTNMTEVQSKTLAKKLNIPNDGMLKWVNDQVTFIRAVDEVVKDEHVNRSSVVNIDGIMLPIYDKDNIKAGKLFPAKSTINNLRSLALAVASGKCFYIIYKILQ